MEPFDLVLRLADNLDALGLDYFVTGSIASMHYGESRFTNDIDVVVELHQNDGPGICGAFPPPEFYCSAEAIDEAIREARQFNIIQPATGLKIDVMVAEDSEFNRSRMRRRRQIKFNESQNVWFASPEDVILKKLMYYQQGGSEKHIRDVLSMLRISDQIQHDYLDKWAEQLKVAGEWKQVLNRLKSGNHLL